MSYSHQDYDFPSHREHFTTSPPFVAKLQCFFFFIVFLFRRRLDFYEEYLMAEATTLITLILSYAL